MRRLTELVVGLCTLGLLTSTWLIQGLFVPLRVASDSMAGAVLGPHSKVDCRDCGFRFALSCETTSPQPIVCPNCGAANDPNTFSQVVGDRLVIDRAGCVLRPPQRWEIVALRCPDRADEVCVKRIIGLPGEAVQIRRGDIYINGRIARKDLRSLLEMAVSVHDEFQPADTESFWRPEDTSSEWRSMADEFTCDRQGMSASSQRVDWLTYEHRQFSALAAKGTPSAILNDIAYNQSESRELAPVPDVMLRCTARVVGDGALLFKVDDFRDEFVVRLSAGTQGAKLLRNGQEVARAATTVALDPPVDVDLALADHQLLLAVNRRVVLEYPYEPSDRAAKPTPHPLAIGAERATAQVAKVRVLRDIFYSPAEGVSATKEYRLGADEYFVLGDNSPVSEDSRSWKLAVPSELILGKALVWRWPSGWKQGHRTVK